MTAIATTEQAHRVASMAVGSGRRLTAIAFAAVLALGCGLRLVGLARAPLHNNELNHYYVARSLQQGNAPVLPSGAWYERGLDYSRLVSLTLDRVQPVELAVRLPAAVLGCVALLLFAGIALQFTRPWAALYATLLFALFPELIDLSRFGRFYTMQMVVGLIAFHAGWSALRRGGPLVTEAGARVSAWRWMIVTAVAFLFAARIQVVTLTVGMGFGAALLLTAAGDVSAHRWRAVRWSVPLQTLLAGMVVTTVLLVGRPDLLSDLRERALGVPYWASASGWGESMYVLLLAQSQPLLVVAGIAALFWSVRRYGASGRYFVLWFLLPFLVHSLLPWKAGRFIMLAMPGLFLAVGIGVADWLSFAHQRGRSLLSRWLTAATAAHMATAGVVLLGAAGVLPTRVLGNAIGGSADSVQDWGTSRAIALRVGENGAIPFGHSLPLPALHYMGRLDFSLNDGLREQWLSRERKRAELGIEGEGGYAWLPMGAPDLYTGTPVLSTAGAIRSRYADRGAVLIGLHLDAAVRGIDAELYETLKREATELCEGHCGPMRLYLWHLTAHPTTGDLP